MGLETWEETKIFTSDFGESWIIYLVKGLDVQNLQNYLRRER